MGAREQEQAEHYTKKLMKVSYLSTAILGVLGVWIAMGMDWLAQSVCFMWRWHKKTWQGCQVIA